MSNKQKEKSENIIQWTAQMRPPLDVSDDGSALKGSFELMIEQLKTELQEERVAAARLRDSIKREASLRLDAEEGLQLLEKELTRQKRKTKKLKKEKSRTKLIEQRLQEEEAKVRSLEKRLESEQARAEQLEREISNYKKKKEGSDAEEDDEEEKRHTERSLSGSGGNSRRWVFTII